MQKNTENLLSFENALIKIIEESRKLSIDNEGCQLIDSLGRVLGQDIFSDQDYPGWDNSAMDGYCVRHQDIELATPEKPISLPISGKVLAGHPLSKLNAGTAAYISTGGIIPEGADCIIKLEDLKIDEVKNNIIVFSPPPLGCYIRRRGNDVRKGELVLRKGTTITPFVQGILAIMGKTVFMVKKRPKVAIVTSGDELIMPFETPKLGQVRNGNTACLTGQVVSSGCEPLDFGILRDDDDKICEKIEQFLQLADILITSGGISLGERDPFILAFKKMGVREIIRGVAIKPGKPFFFGEYKQKFIFGLPGNQASSAVTFELFVRPFIGRVLGKLKPDRQVLRFPLKTALTNTTGRDSFLRGHLVEANNNTIVEVFPKQESHMMSSFVDAQVLVRHPANVKTLSPGELVECWILNLD